MVVRVRRRVRVSNGAGLSVNAGRLALRLLAGALDVPFGPRTSESVGLGT